MLTKRIIPCLDVREGRVVKGTNFVNLKDAGDPVELASMYSNSGADELVFLDITASSEKRKIMLELVKNTAKKVFIPFTVGGGINTIDDIKMLLGAGADKVSINSAAVKNPALIKEASEKFGSQCIVVAIDAKRIIPPSNNNDNNKDQNNEDNNKKKNKWKVYINGGVEATSLDVVEWARNVAILGAGEILLTSIDRDGTKKGYDVQLTKAVSDAVNIPIIASGGAGNVKDIVAVFKKGKADACLAASIFHYSNYSIKKVKEESADAGIEVRMISITDKL